MRRIIRKRQSGKTTRLLYTSDVTKTPIVCASHIRRDVIVRDAKVLGLDIPTPIVVDELVHYEPNSSHHKQDVMVDDAEDVLSALIYKLSRGAYTVSVLTMSEE